MDILWLVAPIGGYLVGSFSSGRLLYHLTGHQGDVPPVEIPVPGIDDKIVVEGSSGSNTGAALGPRLGCLTAQLDIVKAALPTLAFRLLFPSQPYYLAAAAAAMVGHIWPIYYRFKGGRGYSSVWGGMLAIDWLGALVTSVGGLILGMAVVRDFLVAYLAGLWLLIPWLWFRTHSPLHVAYAVSVNILFVLGTLPDIRQYARVRRRIGHVDMRVAMTSNQMGQSMMKIGERLGLMK